MMQAAPYIAVGLGCGGDKLILEMGGSM
jgi:hypothetical protein